MKYKLFGENSSYVLDEPPRGCPNCRSRSDLRIEVPALFHFNGRDVTSPELMNDPVETVGSLAESEDYFVMCGKCDWTGTVRELEPVEE